MPKAGKPKVTTGIERLVTNRFREVQGERVGVLTNQTGVLPGMAHEVDVMAASDDIDIVAVFGPEHGFRGAEQVGGGAQGSWTDEKTGLTVYSFYQKTFEEQAAILAESEADTVIFDIQDVGARFYTFIWQLYDAMMAASQAGVRFVILDRPNPISGRTAAGPVLNPAFASFVGRDRISQQHAMTVGELATLFNEEFLPARLGANIDDLTVVELTGWQRRMDYDDTGLTTWVMPSPNMPTVETATVYPGTCMFEGSNLSEGRGTTRPFEIVGAPFADYHWSEALNALGIDGVEFRETYFQPTFSKHQGEVCAGVQLHVTDRRLFDPVLTGIGMLVTAHQLYPETSFTTFLDTLTGSGYVRGSVESGMSSGDIVTGWQDELVDFAALREQYLRYP